MDSAVWVPLRAAIKTQDGKHGLSGTKEEFFGLGSIAVRTVDRAKALKLQWTDVGIARDHHSYAAKDEYITADLYHAEHLDLIAAPLVLDQRGNAAEPNEWHLLQDFVIALSLKREGDVWVAIDEGYVEVARLKRDDNERPILLEVRAEYLKDYLCARDMALFLSSFRSRVEIVEDAKHIRWPENPMEEVQGFERWHGRLDEIHEGGMPYGAETAVFHVERTDVDGQEDVPSLRVPPSDENVRSTSWITKSKERKLFRVSGELWRSEWVELGANSPRVRDDHIPPTSFFVVDAAGKRENATALLHSGQWLWFRPDVIMALAHRRGGELWWYTQDTGNVSGSPGHGVHFGMNALGLVTVYAKDIAMLPDWQQQIWAGFNMGPDGKVAEELLASQVHASPADTQAPEAFLPLGIRLVNQVATEKLGQGIIKEHGERESILTKVHRFRAIDTAGLYSLAKDVARVTADSIDATALQRIVKPPQGQKWGSLKSLDKVLALKSDHAKAHAIMAPLFAVYDLRLADAHLPAEDLTQALALLGVDEDAPLPIQGLQLLSAVVTAIYQIADVLKKS